MINNKADKRLYYSTEEIAKIYMVKPATARRWARKNKLEAKKIGKRWLFDIPTFVRDEFKKQNEKTD